MPPKKKPKIASRGPSTPSQADSAPPSADTPSNVEGAKRPDADYDLVSDPWTDEQETSLLKGIIRWKPVGMHKHFRMIAIAEYMRSQGYASPSEPHTRIPGIWKKLGTLYNLPALDEREDALITEGSEDADPSKEPYCPFELPEDEYGDMMFARRLAVEASLSPTTSGQPESRRGSTVADTDEPRSSPAPSRGRRTNRTTRTATRGTRSTRLQVEVEAPKKSPSDRASPEEDEEMEDAEEEDEGTDAAKEESEGSDEPEAETGGSEKTRSTRTQSSRAKQKEKKGAGTGGGTATRRTGRRR
ncbi:CT20 family protein [Paecilomyces variotii No. 5]|uniref:CT20 family protein n=1 Tax=Byssochlamys spectabilis (strain No. 5 / NBRC 109023) TaxID=1356009 RepID=V5G3F9_BYSSN|nr:CT20 family protein [Paecilomyces variotii No. 5]